MKRKDAQMTINRVGAMTLHVEGAMCLLNDKDGTGVEVDMPSLLSTVRGVLAWCDHLLDDETEDDLSTREQMKKLLVYVGRSIARDISDEEE